jgi:hypothetical protein
MESPVLVNPSPMRTSFKVDCRMTHVDRQFNTEQSL